METTWLGMNRMGENTLDTYLLFEEITLHCIRAVQLAKLAKTYSLKFTKDVFFPFIISSMTPYYTGSVTQPLLKIIKYGHGG